MQVEDLGKHHFAQDFKRLHFGLGPNTHIDQLVIKWPSGIVQELDDVSADQILSIVESPAGHDLATARLIPANFAGLYQGVVSSTSGSDFYKFEAAFGTMLELSLTGTGGPVQVQLLDADSGKSVAVSGPDGTGEHVLSA